MKRLDLNGKTFGRLAVVECAGPDAKGAVCWRVRCKCGNERSFRGSDLKRGFVKSCGCLSSDLITTRNTSHGGSATRLYRIWQAMHDRTGNPKASRYAYYGARGIAVCTEWTEFGPFRDWALANGYADDLSIDRIDNDGNYEPSNCRWADQTTQVRNRRPRSALSSQRTET